MSFSSSVTDVVDVDDGSVATETMVIKVQVITSE